MRGSGRRVEAVMWVLAVMPASKLKVITDAVGGVDIYTNTALSLHDYRYNGLDPDMALSKYATRESAVADVVELLQELLRRVEVHKGRVSWTEELEKSLEEVKVVSARWM